MSFSSSPLILVLFLSIFSRVKRKYILTWIPNYKTTMSVPFNFRGVLARESGRKFVIVVRDSKSPTFWTQGQHSNFHTTTYKNDLSKIRSNRLFNIKFIKFSRARFILFFSRLIINRFQAIYTKFSCTLHS